MQLYVLQQLLKYIVCMHNMYNFKTLNSWNAAQIWYVCKSTFDFMSENDPSGLCGSVDNSQDI